MGAENILESYLVKVGALPDTASFTRLGESLKSTEKLVQGFGVKTVKTMVELELATVGAFTAAGIAMIAAADKAAMTDQSYRLLGLRMLMNKSSARSMQVALDELGATIDEVAYDPELNKRFQYLYEQNMKLGKTMGSTYDKNMIGIRDLRMEYKRFGAEFEFLVGGTISKAFEKLGYGSGDLQKSLSGFNDWVTDNLPHIADQVSDYLIPVWEDSKAVVKDFGHSLMDAAGEFTYLTGVLYGDKSIQDTTFSIEKMAKAVQHLVDTLAEASLSSGFSFRTLGHLVTGAGGIAAANFHAATGDVAGGRLLLKSGEEEFGKGTTNIKDMWQGDDTGNWRTNPDFKGILEHETDLAGRSGAHTTMSPDSDKLDDIIKYDAYKYNVNPAIIKAMIHQESGGKPGARSRKGAQGLMQLMPGTASDYGVKDPFNPSQSIEGGTHYISDLLKRYNMDIPKALAAYNAGPGKVDLFGGVPPYKETQDYVSRIMKEFSASGHGSMGSTVEINGPITINVPHDLPERNWHEFIHDSMNNIINKNTKTVIAQTAGGAYH
jgi:hypothetical protein